MSSRLPDLKAGLRASVRARLQRLPAGVRAQASAEACRRLQQEAVWQHGGALLAYAPTRDELDVWPLIRDALTRNRIVAFPRFDKTTGSYLACQVTDAEADLIAGQFEILEPRPGCPTIPLNRLDFVLVPGVAFTLDGRRLGRGKGFYDRLLASVPGLKCGVAFDEQIVDQLPAEPHDVRVDGILTPTQWRRAGCNAAMK